MKLLLDQGLPRSTAALLREMEIDAIHVGELDMSATPDVSIIEYARSNGYSIVTLDADFHSLIATAASAAPSVIRLRMFGIGETLAVGAPEGSMRGVGVCLDRASRVMGF
jgi:predicted nuclease of predicted toxin-antitoxin system